VSTISKSGVCHAVKLVEVVVVFCSVIIRIPFGGVYWDRERDQRPRSPGGLREHRSLKNSPAVVMVGEGLNRQQQPGIEPALEERHPPGALAKGLVMATVALTGMLSLCGVIASVGLVFSVVPGAPVATLQFRPMSGGGHRGSGDVVAGPGRGEVASGATVPPSLKAHRWAP
jgi:hypothetical protein